MTGTQLYNQGKQTIYPITHAEVVQSDATGNGDSKETVESNLKALWSEISNLTGAADATKQIRINITYTRATTSDKDEIKLDTISWGSEFESPTSDLPYTWKRTIITYAGQDESTELNTTYEIVAAQTAEVIQNIYIAKSTGIAPTITYPVLEDGYGEPILGPDGKQQEDLTAFDNVLPEGWSETPVSIGPATPYVFISTRKKINAKWQRFSEPAQFGRWAFDSQLEMRYTVTAGDIPTVNSTSTDPGSIWSVDGPTDFTGKLWMITATSVNNVLNAADDGTIWRGPNLLSIIQ